MADRPLSLQDQFLNGVRKSKSPSTVFLVKGVKLQGMITWFDAFSLLLRRDSSSQLVYKHAISTIMPQRMPADLLGAGFTAPKGGGKASLQDIFLSAAARDRSWRISGILMRAQKSRCREPERPLFP